MNFLAVTLAVTLFTAAPEDLCTPQVQVREAAHCSAYGPGDYAAQFSTAHAPLATPQLPLTDLPFYDPVVDFTYAHVTTPAAPVFATPDDALAGNVKETLGQGFVYVSLGDPVAAGDQTLFPIRRGGYIRASDVSAVEPTTFQGVGLGDNPLYPFGWIVANKVRPSRLPGGAPSTENPVLRRRALVQIFATQRVGEWDWYLIGHNQWIEQRALGKVDVNPPPQGVSGKWIQVNLYEQTMAAYEDGRMLYATLVSSGLDKWSTDPGLFSIWAKLKADRMSGAYEPDKSDYYYLEAVPWVMYFDGSKALHGEYWHDRLGFKRSHGCVNLAPQDARWLYDWTEVGTPVWVYDPHAGAPADTVAEGP